MSAVYVCECEHPKTQHKRERDGCRALDCGCSKFEADLNASAKAQGAEFAVGTADLPRPAPDLGESTSAVLRRVEMERDQALARHQDVTAELASARTELEQLRGAENERDALAVDYAQKDLDLIAARAELEQLRQRALHFEGRAVDQLAATVNAQRALAATADVLDRWDAMQCQTCGRRYRVVNAEPIQHDHPLTAVQVAITRRAD